MERQQIDQIKRLSIVNYLDGLSIEPAKTHGQKLYYHSPFHSDSTPSFVVNLDSNTFKDFADDEKPEDIIRLVQRLHGLNFKEACEHLTKQTILPALIPFLSNGQNPSLQPFTEMTLLETKPLQSSFLTNYVESRKIDLALAYLYLDELTYSNKGKVYKGIGFKNNSGGYEIKAADGRKFTINPKNVTYYPVEGSTIVSVFEGFFDFLSALMYHQTTTSKHSIVVLNSTANIAKSLPILAGYQTIHAYLDNDEAGRKALTKLETNGINVVDGSFLYEGFKDFNEFWMTKNS